ncbi:MAG: hypothetical protein ACI9F9_001011 [Candidatus Paceibacteria bacterium]|jgi:hypothetical protein
MRSINLPAIYLVLAGLGTPCLASEPALNTVGHRTLSSPADKLTEYEKKRTEAGKDEAKLWKLYEWCVAFDLGKQGRSCCRAILKKNDNHTGAHEALGHIDYDGQWFKTAKKLANYQQAEELRIAEEQGLIKYKGEWVSEEDLPYLKRGMSRDTNGGWINAEDLKRQQDGWIKQDLVWVSPDETDNIGKGLWKCGERWLTLEEANAYHAKIGSWWIIPTDRFILYTTVDRETSEKVIDHMGRAYGDVQKALGKLSESAVAVTVFRDAEQYSTFASGAEERRPTESRGLSSIHWAYLAADWYEGSELEFLGSGVGYWDASTEAGNSFGVHSVRHATALSLLEAADPSPKVVGYVQDKGLDRYKGDDFWAEKQLPEWFRFGVASYTDRYFVDQFAAKDKYNWAREWSIQNLQVLGGMTPVAAMFDTKLDINQMESSLKLMSSLGLLFAFALDGENKEVIEAHAAVKAALREGEDPAKALKALRKVLTKNEPALREFAGI